MDLSPSQAAQAHASRMTLDLRTIVVSSRTALAKIRTDYDSTVQAQVRIAGLLDAFEQRVLNDGRDPTLLAGIKAAREELLG